MDDEHAIKLTSLANDNRLVSSLDKAHTVFTIVEENFDNIVIDPAKKALIATTTPENIPGWERSWSNTEKLEIEKSGCEEKCRELQRMGNASKQDLAKLATNMDRCVNEMSHLVTLADSSKLAFQEVEGLINDFEDILVDLSVSGITTEKSEEWKQKIQLILDDLGRAYVSLKRIPSSVHFLQGELRTVVDGVAGVFLCAHTHPDEDFFSQLSETLVEYINKKHEKATGICSYQKQAYDGVYSFFESFASKGEKLAAAAQQMIDSSESICARARDFRKDTPNDLDK
ncbi:MAG: hypothetical protein P1U74_08350 [Legionellaceae bacterium]|nr:hypothetical protein [Legionellaceae bacterium]